MGVKIKLNFSGIPEVGDFIRINDNLAQQDVIETFVANRTNPKEVTIGSTIEETIYNFETAFNLDYDSDLIYFIQKTESELIINFTNGGSGTFNETISSDVITYEIIESDYIEKFEANYTNNSGDQFKILILIRDEYGAQTKEFISAYADLSYKDVDNILSPIRGAQLDISINSSISKPFDLFLDFKEKDFKAELYRNDNLIFQGFINPEGITQPFTSQYWVSQITAVDNLAVLKNTSLKYDNELPSEHVLLDLCLKETGLNLPIAFFDDINFRRKNSSGVTSFYGKSIWRGDRERIIDPLVFKNDNGRFVSCEKVIEDILNKYNAVLVQQSITHENGTDLCWVFYRPSIFFKTWDFISNAQFPVVEITGYNTVTKNGFQNIKEPIINELGRVNPKTYKLGTKDTRFQDAYYKNSNQLIRQSRALQNFRFVQEWINKDTIFDYKIENFTPLSTSPDGLYFMSTGAFLTTQPITYTSIEIDIPTETSVLDLNGTATIVGDSQDLPNYGKALLFTLLHQDLNGDYWQLKANYEDDLPLQFRPDKIIDVTWEQITDFNSFNNNITYFDYLLLTLENNIGILDVEFQNVLPPLTSKGGTIKLLIPPFIGKTAVGSTSDDNLFQLTLNNINVKAVPPASLGQGEFHDALNLQNISSKLDDPLDVINADETTNFFRNGLRFLPISTSDSPKNYSFWTTDYNQVGSDRLLELMSKERIRLFSKSQNIFSGDIGNYIPYFGRIQNQAYSNIFFNFTKWIYRTAENTIEAEMREIGVRNPNVEYENSIIFEDEENRLIE